MKYVEAPEEHLGGGRSLFLAGGISGCREWQREFAQLLRDTSLVVLNPRRRSFPMDDPSAAEAQIGWEFRHHSLASAASFWFPPETLCPIALYELGRWSAGARPLYVGTDRDYRRRVDVQVQMKLARPAVRVVQSLNELAAQVIAATRRESCS